MSRDTRRGQPAALTQVADLLRACGVLSCPASLLRNNRNNRNSHNSHNNHNSHNIRNKRDRLPTTGS